MKIVKDEETTKLFDYTEKSTMISPKQLLEKALSDMETDSIVDKLFKNPPKMVILYLNDIDDRYDVGFVQAQMKLSEIVGLLEIVKSDIIKMLNCP